jgi:hypothetical protein
MTVTRLYCPEDARRALVRADPALNAIDYLEVLDDDAPVGTSPQQTLLVHFFKPVSGSGLDGYNVRIDGGVRVRPIHVEWAFPAQDVPGAFLTSAEQSLIASLEDADRILVVRTRERGDLSTYRLTLTTSQTSDEPPAGFDPLLSGIDFSFKVECPSEFDCFVDRVCREVTAAAPHIDYLAKDYASFKRLMLDRLAITMPAWNERNAADVGTAIVELFAYVGDYLSYHQDAVAAESYLGTARRRVSVRRHARLVDYFIGDGCNARAWVAVEVAAGSGADGATLPEHTILLTGEGGGTTVPAADLEAELAASPVVFETMHDVTAIAPRNSIELYTWGDPRCCLLEGATQASLSGTVAGLQLVAGDALIFEEVLGEDSGLAVDADPSRRHVVRLDEDPIEVVDPATGESVVEVHWHAEDALPFPLCLRQFPDGSGGVRGVTVARGNVVLADSGRTIADEELVPPQAPTGRRYRPVLAARNLTHARDYDHASARLRPGADATRADIRNVMPVVTIAGEGEHWTPQRDLLNSNRFSTEFVVEMEEDGRAYIRFGDDVLGRAPAEGQIFTAIYRVGNGSAANVGAGVIRRIVTAFQGVERINNPLAASGGTDPERIDQVKLYAPQAFRIQQRAVTEADYAEVVGRHPEVQKAAATRRWTGSWHTMFVTVDRRGGRAVDARFEGELRAFLERFRLAGYDLEIDAPRFVPLDILFTVCVAEGHLRSNVKAALIEVFGNRDLPDGSRGFFHPDNFTFGQPVYLSRMVAEAMKVPGVAWIDTKESPTSPNRFRRWGRESHGERDAGLITMGRLEIARLDNDANAAENGRIEFIMRGGL